MKRCIAVCLCLLVLSVALVPFAFAQTEYPVKREALYVRDPWVLPYEGKYYMYGTGLSRGLGYGCSVSEDLENWSNPIQIFSPDADFDGCNNYWAPECHIYEGNFYLFATYLSETTQKRGVGIFKSDSPTGPFTLITDGHITPKDIDCIDGTLYVDEDGQPWMIYVNEWTSQPDGIGEMAAAMLSDDLTQFISTPVVLFHADDPMWADGQVTDGPFVHKTADGTLVMLWSNNDDDGYAVGMAISATGKINGSWVHYPKTLYSEKQFGLDGGHPMLFESFDGTMYLSIHSPNENMQDGVQTAAKFLPVEESDMGISVVGAKNNVIENMFINLYLQITLFFTRLFDRLGGMC